MQWFKKSEEEQRKDDQRKRIEEAKQDEKYRAPNPCQTKFPEENFIEMIVTQEGQQIKLATYRFPTKGEPKAIVFMFHGLSAHINHGAHIAEKLANSGFLVVGFDHRGFGKSEGLRGYIENIDIHLSDSRLFISKVLQQFGNQKIPIFLSGLSMGGMTSFLLAIKGQFENLRGIILYAPAIKPHMNNFIIGTLNLMGKIMPKYKLIKPKRGLTTRNPQISEDLAQDPYTYFEEFLPRTLASITGSMKDCSNMYNQLKTPWIVIQGGIDKMVDPDLAEQLKRESPSTDKTILFYDEMWHDVWHEQEINDIIPKVIDWINKRC